MKHLEAIVEANDPMKNLMEMTQSAGDKLGACNGNGRALTWQSELDRIRVRECIEASKGPMDHDVTLQDDDMETGPGLEHADVPPLRIVL